MEPSIETFYKSVAQSPAALSELTAGVQTPDEFIDRAVSLGKEQGYQFTREEASTWINDQIAARKNGELSDVQLEGVAGGKGASQTQTVSVGAVTATQTRSVSIAPPSQWQSVQWLASW